MTIDFYHEDKRPYGIFSNFAPFGVELDGHAWRTVEHFFQAQKFEGTASYFDVLWAPTPRAAKNIGHDRARPFREDWEAVKDRVMLRGVRAKFRRHDCLREILLGTGEVRIVERAKNDYYWGSGEDGTGENKLGKILMRVRDELRG